MYHLKLSKMKAKILSFLFVLSAALLISTSAFAQPSVTTIATSDSHANKGATTSYTIGGGATSGFVWAIRADGANTGTASISVQTTNVQSVTWTSAAADDIYYLDAYYVDATGCYSEMLTYKVTITDAKLCVKTTAGTETLNGVDAVAPDITQTCSLLANGNTGDASSAYGGDVSTFYLTIKSALPTTVYTVTYSVGGTNQTPVTITTDAAGESALAVTVTTTDFATLFTNGTSGSVNATIAAVSMTGVGNAQVITSACSYDIAVNPTPVITF